MGFGEAIRTCFRKYVVFQGRARRSEYWYFYLFSILAGFAAGILDAIFEGVSGGAASAGFRNTGPFAGVLNLVIFLPSIAVSVRRLHDTNRSGWLLLGFVGYLIVAIIAFLAVLSATRGGAGATVGANGPSIVAAVVLVLGGLGYGIFLLICMVQNGTAGENAYGSDPKGPDVAVFS